MPSTATEEVLEETHQEQEESTETTIKRKPKAPKARLYRDKPAGEDFFEYINAVPQEERSLARLRFWAINQDGSIGGMVHQIVGGWTDIDESWMKDQPQIGTGKFKVELRNPGKTGRANDYTIVQIGSDEEISKQRLIKQGLSKEGGAGAASELHGVTKGIDAFASATEKGLGFLEKSYEKALERSQVASDPAAMLKAAGEMLGKNDPIASIKTVMELFPKRDDSFMVTLLENQRKDAELRAARDIKEANDRAERDQKFFQLMIDSSEKRSAERMEMMKAQLDMQGKFFEVLLKEKEKKADEFGITEMLKGIVVPLVKDRLEGAGGSDNPWVQAAETLGPKLVDGFMAFQAARSGASPQQVAQIMQQSQNQNQQPQPEGEFPELITRIAKYLSQDRHLWDGSYIVRMIETEYPVIYAQMNKEPKEAIFSAIAQLSVGNAILNHLEPGIPENVKLARIAASQLLENVVDVIKNPDLFDTVFPEDEEPEPEEPPPGPQRRRKPNGHTIIREKGGEGA